MTTNLCRGLCDRLTPFSRPNYRLGRRYCPRCAAAFQVKGRDRVDCPCCGHALRYNARRAPMSARRLTDTRKRLLPPRRLRAEWTEADRRQYNEYQRKYYRRNACRLRAASRARYARDPDASRRYYREYYRRNACALKAKQRRYYTANIEKERARRRRYHLARRGRPRA